MVKGDKTEIYLNLKGLSFMNMFGHLTNIKVYEGKFGSKLTPASIVEKYTDKDLDKKDREFPKVVKIERNNAKESQIYVNVSVDAVASIASNGASPYTDENKDKGSQNAIIVLDYSKAEKVGGKEPEKNEDKNKANTDKKADEVSKLSIKSERISGRNRYLTSVQISRNNFSKADTVILANGRNYADALAAAPLASVNSAPILLTESSAVPAETMSEIARLGAKKIIIAGGKSSVSSEIEGKLKNKGMDVERIAGRNRYSTSMAIAEKVREKSDDKKSVILVSGQNFADALSVSSLSTKNSTPIVLSEAGSLPSESKKTINGWNLEKLTVVGGRNSVSDSVMKSVNAKSVSRIAGKSRYSTSVEVAKAAYGKAGSVLMASGENAADALSAGAVTAKLQRPLILVSKNSLSQELKEFIKTNSIANVTILGGEGSVAPNILAGL